jgi:hypothetical protein
LGFNVLNLRKKLETHLNFVCVLRDPKRARKLHRGFSQLCYLNEGFRFGAQSQAIEQSRQVGCVVRQPLDGEIWI